jgi:hypothetical protein
MGFVVYKAGIGAGFLRELRFPLAILVPPTAPHSSSIILGWYNRSFSGRRTKWIQFHPTQTKYLAKRRDFIFREGGKAKQQGEDSSGWIRMRNICADKEGQRQKMEIQMRGGNSVTLCSNLSGRKSRYGRAIAQGAPSSSSGQVMWNLCWTKWHWGRFSPSTSVSLTNFHPTDSYTVFFIYHLSSGAGTIGQLVADV